MKINWKLRFQNKATLIALLAAAVAFVYQIIGIFGIIPPISEDSIVQALGIFVDVLTALGIVVDSTTAGVGDSEQALSYDKPRG